MGFYINLPLPKQKAEQLRQLYGAKDVNAPHHFDFSGPDALICVVSNTAWDAAGICFDRTEFTRFQQDSSGRRKEFLTLPKEKVLELVPELPRDIFGN